MVVAGEKKVEVLFVFCLFVEIKVCCVCLVALKREGGGVKSVGLFRTYT